MIQINSERLRADLESLALIGAEPGAGITRTSFSPEDALARQWYKDRVDAAGLTLELDGLGNMFAYDPAASTKIPGVWTGSHIDTVPQGGAFDGAVGSLAALECIRRIKELGLELDRPVRAVVFSDEEGNYSGLLGSTGLRHGQTMEQLERFTGRDGDRLVDALANWAWANGSPTETKLGRDALHAFVELHIEQGPHLERQGIDIGVVTSIVGLGGGRVAFIGRTDHAGTTPMLARADALVAASEFVTSVPAIAAAVGPDAVATCGFMHVQPGAANVVAGEVEVSLDFRDLSVERVEQLQAGLERAAREIASAHGLDVRWSPNAIIPPAPLHDLVRTAVSKSATELGLTSMDQPSFAGHDSQNMAFLAPTGMIFIPSVGGRSHSPAEFTNWADIENGANVLLATLLKLASH